MFSKDLIYNVLESLCSKLRIRCSHYKTFQSSRFLFFVKTKIYLQLAYTIEYYSHHRVLFSVRGFTLRSLLNLKPWANLGGGCRGFLFPPPTPRGSVLLPLFSGHPLLRGHFSNSQISLHIFTVF